MVCLCAGFIPTEADSIKSINIEKKAYTYIEPTQEVVLCAV